MPPLPPATRALLRSIACGVVLVGGLGWWWRTREVDRHASREPALELQATGAIDQRASARPTPALEERATDNLNGPKASSEPVLQRMLRGDAKLNVTPQMLTGYLLKRQFSPEALLMAYGVTRDPELLAQLVPHLEGNAAIAATLAMNLEAGPDRARALAEWQRLEPGDALPRYLQAADELAAGRVDEALEELRGAMSAPEMSDYALQALDASEEALREAGFGVDEAKIWALLRTPREMLGPLYKLGKAAQQQQAAFAAAGDEASAGVVKEAMLKLAERLKAGSPLLIDELLGIAIDDLFLDSALPTDALQQQANRTTKTEIMKLVSQNLPRHMPLQDVPEFTERARKEGEKAALRWLQKRLAKP